MRCSSSVLHCSATFFLTLFLLFVVCLPMSAAATSTEIEELAERAYTYGYPLVIMDRTKWTMVLSADTASHPEGSLLNRFDHARAFVTPSYTDVVNPNADTLYSMGWLDLGATPMRLSLPEMDSEARFYLMQFLDAWTNNFTSLGSRETGNGAGNYLIVGPNWDGTPPPDAVLVRAPTEMVWIVGRTQTNGPDDYAAVNALQDKYLLTPLDPTAKPFLDFDADCVTPAPDQLAVMSCVDFFNLLNSLMVENPPASLDKSLIEEMAAIGLLPGEPFTKETLSPDVYQAVERGYTRARDYFATESLFETVGEMRGVWVVLPESTGRYGDDYYLRTVIARAGLGANLPEDAIYPSAFYDEDKALFHGSKNYVVHFEPESIPVPVGGFWSLTIYNEQHTFVDNPLDRYTLGDRSELILDEDGGLTIYVQRETPGEALESNWLPAPAGSFNLLLRFYWPDKSIQDGSWKMPTVRAAGGDTSGGDSSGGGCATGAFAAALACVALGAGCRARRMRMQNASNCRRGDA